MSFGLKFKIYLRQSATVYYTVDASGAVITTGAKTPLKHDPDGWAETEVANVRSALNVGIERQYAAPYKFADDGAQILRYLDYAFGDAAQCQIEIELRNDYDGTYLPYFVGDVDFSAANDGDYFYIVPLKDLGLASIMQNAMDIEIEIPITGPEVVNATIDSFLLLGNATWITAYPTPYVPNTPLPWVYYVFNKQDTVGYPITANNQTYGFASGSGQPFWIFQANQTLYNVDVSGIVKFQLQNTQSGPVTYTVNFTHGATIIGLTSGSVPGGQTANFDIDLSTIAPFGMSQGDVVRLYVGTSPGQIDPNSSTPSPYTLSWRTGDTFTVNYRFYGPSFNVTGLRPAELWKRIVEKVAGPGYTGVSSYLSDANIKYRDNYDNIPFQTPFLSGESIRGIPNPKFKLTPGDFISTCRAVWGCGYGVEGNTARIEPRRHFFNPDLVIIAFDDPNSVSIQKATEYRFKKYTVGYSTQPTEKVNGRDEYNSKSVLEGPTKRSAPELNMVSPAIGSMYTLFNTYVEYAFRDTADSPEDNEMFLLEIQNFQIGGRYPARKWPGYTITGVAIGDQGLNFGITPKRNFLRSGDFIHIGNYGQDNNVIKFQLAEKNSELQSNLLSGTIVEKADVPVSSLKPALALPYLIVANVNSPRNIIELMSGNYGVIGIRWRENYIYGFPIKVGCRSATTGEYEITLLASPNNDLTLFA